MHTHTRTHTLPKTTNQKQRNKKQWLRGFVCVYMCTYTYYTHTHTHTHIHTHTHTSTCGQECIPIKKQIRKNIKEKKIPPTCTYGQQCSAAPE